MALCFSSAAQFFAIKMRTRHPTFAVHNISQTQPDCNKKLRESPCLSFDWAGSILRLDLLDTMVAATSSTEIESNQTCRFRAPIP